MKPIFYLFLFCLAMMYCSRTFAAPPEAQSKTDSEPGLTQQQETDSIQTSRDATSKKDGEAQDLTAFKPIIEAALPEGFPVPDKVGVVQLRHYPAYRKAVTPHGTRTGSFMRLFRHIKSNDIAMTAPVEMTIKMDRNDYQDMAFLYQDRKTESTPTNRKVEVVDVPAAMYLSLGIKGSFKKREIKDGKAKLAAWLEENPQYEAHGEYRTLGYNSPMVSRDKRYWELQVKVTHKTETGNAPPAIAAAEGE